MKNLLPKNSKKVFQGEIFDVYQWKQKMFNGSYEIFEAVGRDDSVEVIAVTRDKKFIVLRQRQPNTDWFYSLPGGRVDMGEDPLKAAKRELLEETGHRSKSVKFLVKSRLSSKLVYYAHIFYALNCEKADKLKLDAGEKISLKFYSFDQFVNLAENPVFRCSGNLKIILIRAMYDKKSREKFRKIFFPK